MAVIHQLPLADRVTAEAARAQTGRALATAAAALPYGLGYAAGLSVVGARWIFTAVKLGWKDAQGNGRAA